jgi:hypothetical protein
MEIRGSCHCKAIQFVVSAEPAEVTRCTCSICSKKGALWAYYPPEQFRLLTPPERVSTYVWRSPSIRHHHCGVCGCTTHLESPEWANGRPDPTHTRVGVNARLFDAFELDAVPVRLLDGKNLW